MYYLVKYVKKNTHTTSFPSQLMVNNPHHFMITQYSFNLRLVRLLNYELIFYSYP